MRNKKQAQFITPVKAFFMVSFVLGTLLLLEPLLRGKITFAITFFDRPTVNYEQLEKAPSFEQAETQTGPVIPQKSHAPEPSSLFLILGGISGIVVRFAQKSFKKFKRASDYFLSILGLLIASPLLIFAAILIKFTSRGPVIYKQDRVGKKGDVFQIYKLRTMCVDAEKGIGAIWAKKNDPRITSVGRILRKTHIDEIPQLFNVIKGQMSIVGPRPERPEMVRDFKTLILDYEKRLQVEPGITGLAQVWHKYDETIEDVKKKIKYDVLYIKRMCLWVDLRIMARTFTVVLTGRGAR